MQISEAVTAFMQAAQQHGAYTVLQNAYPGMTVTIPYYHRMAEVSIDELNLSVRANNGLKRRGAMTMADVAGLIKTDTLRSVRNLGEKSEKEIVRQFFLYTYDNLKETEKQKFWQNLLREMHPEQE